MQDHRIVSPNEWLEARGKLLAREKEFTRLRDELSEARRALPWVRVAKDYAFDGRSGAVTLGELFEGRHQLVIYHFMFAPDWEVGCKSCSFWADNLDGIVPHLNARDVSFALISRAPLEKLLAFQRRMGWKAPWYSSSRNEFNFDYRVSFTPEDVAGGELTYNYRSSKTYGIEMPGISVFYKDDESAIFHTYSCYARGLDMMNTAYHVLDLVPKGRDEAELPFSMAWVRLKDQYAA